LPFLQDETAYKANMSDPASEHAFTDLFAPERRPDCQLYLISPPQLDAGFSDRVRAAGEAGSIAAFQLRLKATDDHAIARAAEPLQKICADLDISFIVNDSVALCKRLGADGVHLGQGDGDPREARDILGRDVQIGVTCHNSRHFAMQAGDAGADYVAFGAFYPTGTKKIEHFADLDILRWWTTLSGIPCVAIGGITPENAAPIVAAGADFLAISGAVWNDPDGPAAAVAKFTALFSGPEGSVSR
jgi:thiamine-phosphate pyrophosphorylase